MGKVRVAILDIDGTLLYSNEEHARAFVEAAGQLGIPTPGLEEVRRMIGMGGDKLIPKAFGFEAESERGKQLDRVKGEIFRERYGPSLQATPGSRNLLLQLKDDGLRLVVATSASGDDLDLLLQRAGVQDLVDECTTSSDVDASKPDPDVVEAALKLGKAAPEEAVMIGDTPYDVAASRRAGVRIVGVRTGGWTAEELDGAVAVYRDPAELLDRYSSSVFR